MRHFILREVHLSTALLFHTIASTSQLSRPTANILNTQSHTAEMNTMLPVNELCFRMAQRNDLWAFPYKKVEAFTTASIKL